MPSKITKVSNSLFFEDQIKKYSNFGSGSMVAVPPEEASGSYSREDIKNSFNQSDWLKKNKNNFIKSIGGMINFELFLDALVEEASKAQGAFGTSAMTSFTFINPKVIQAALDNHMNNMRNKNTNQNDSA